MDSERLTVRFRDCECPGTPHPDGDVVYLRPTLGFAAGAAALRAMGEAIVVVSPTGGGPKGTDPIIDDSRSDELVGPVYLREGPSGWNVVDDDGPVPYDPQVLIDNYVWGYPVVEACSALYTEAVLSPLVSRMNAQANPRKKGPSKTGRNGVPTQVTRRSSDTHPSPRKSSSPVDLVGPQSVTNP